MSHDVDYDDLMMARDRVIALSRRRYPNVMALDTVTPQVKSGLHVVQFDVPGAMAFCDELARSNMERLAAAKKEYGVMLFAAALGTGLVYGAQAERDRDS